MTAVALLLPGQGMQQPAMGAGLYRHEPVFTAEMDRFFDALDGFEDADGSRVRRIWLDPGNLDVHSARFAQPLLFAVGHALGRMVQSKGLRVTALLGHSVGELAAACLAGVFTLEDGARLMAARTRSFADAPDGGMLAVSATAAEVRSHLPGDAVIGAINGPRQVIVSASADELDKTQDVLRAAGYTCRRVPSDLPFHSPVLAQAATRLRQAWQPVALKPPQLCVYSTATAEVLTADQACRPEFWCDQIAGVVRFWPALNTLLSKGKHVLVEAGPATGLTVLVRRHSAIRCGTSKVIPLLPAAAAAEADRAAVDHALAAVHSAGAYAACEGQ